MSWPHEPMRHSLASRGIRTRAIVNPMADPKWYQEHRYGPSDSIKGLRKYRGTGLETLDEDEIINWVRDAVKFINQYLEEDRGVKIGLDIQAIYLVGSRVSGFYVEGSDLDVVVEFKDVPLRIKSRYLDEIDDAVIEVDVVTRNDPAWWISTGDEYIGMDVQWGWEGPEEESPYIEIWRAS